MFLKPECKKKQTHVLSDSCEETSRTHRDSSQTQWEETRAPWEPSINQISSRHRLESNLPHLPDLEHILPHPETGLPELSHPQVLTGREGFAAQLHRVHFQDSPPCVCDVNCDETTQLNRSNFHTTMDNQPTRTPLLASASKTNQVVFTANKTHVTQQQQTISGDTNPRNMTVPSSTTINLLLAQGESAEPGIRTRGVALFMNRKNEKLGISFCHTGTRKHVAISPGLAALVNGSTSKTNMKRETFDALPKMKVADHHIRLLQTHGKVIALFEWGKVTPFAQACSVLEKIGETEIDKGNTARTISVDAMVVEYKKGDVADRYGCIKASEKHEVVVYEDRGENLSFLKVLKHDTAGSTQPTGSQGYHIQTFLSGSERAQQKVAAEKAAKEKKKNDDSKKSDKQKEALAKKEKEEAISKLTRADKGHINPPSLRPVTTPLDHVINAFLEYHGIMRATKEVNIMKCKKILDIFQVGYEGLLKEILKKEEAAVYDNNTFQVLKGTMSSEHYMAAFNATSGFVALDEDETKRIGNLKFAAPQYDPIVITAQCTKTMLEDRILKMAQIVLRTLDSTSTRECWVVPKIKWVNGVPGCGKTTWLVNNFDGEKDVIVTMTTEKAKDLRQMLAHRIGDHSETTVRTMTSILTNGFSDSDRCQRLMVDDALMNHFGAIIMASRLSGAAEIILIGDINQLFYCDRENLFELKYCRPNLLVTISDELYCSHRNPMDVAYALSEIHPGIYSSKSQVHSLKVDKYTGAQIPKTSPNTLFLVYTEEQKRSLISQGYGSGTRSRTLIIHEAQGLTCDLVFVVNVKNKKKLKIRDSFPDAVVAISRHTVRCVYYTDDTDDAIGHLVKRAMDASTKDIVDYNLKMAMQHRDETVVQALIKKKKAEPVCRG